MEKMTQDIFKPIKSYRRIGVTGSRKYPDLDKVRKFIKKLAPQQTTIITGESTGVDTTTEDEARRQGIQVEIQKPDQIAKNSDILVTFWWERSPGTAAIIRRAREELGKRVIIQ
jgi:hypothetical protein